MILQLRDLLAGKKTYITAILTIAYAALSYYFGKMDLNQTMEMIFAAMGAASFRAALNK